MVFIRTKLDIAKEISIGCDTGMCGSIPSNLIFERDRRYLEKFSLIWCELCLNHVLCASAR